jgi:hypothetical protein
MRLAWSRLLPAIPSGLSLAREAGWFLIRDVEDQLGRFDRQGQCEHRQRALAPLVAAVLSDDGKTAAAVGKRGQVWGMTCDLVPIWQRSIRPRPVALALDAHGKRLAVADEAGGLHLFDRTGQLMWHTSVARPLIHLAFVPEAPVLIGSAEYGLVCVFDQAGRCLWRDGLVAHVGGLAVTGDGQSTLACFTDGLNRYPWTQAKKSTQPHAGPSRLVALDYRGENVLTAGLDQELAHRQAGGETRSSLTLSSVPVALAMEALGDSAIAVLAGGELVRIILEGVSE